MEAYVGLDAHSKRSVFVIANAAGEVIGRGDVPTTPAGLATLRTEGRGQLSRCLRSDIGWTKLHATLAEHPDLARYIELHHAVWRATHAQVLALDDQLAPTAAPCGDALRRLQTIPGVGPIVALT